MVCTYRNWWMGFGQPIWVGCGWCKWLWFVWAGRKNGFVWYFPVWRREGGRRGLNGRELHAGSIVAWGNGVAGGRAFVFNEKWGNVGVTPKPNTLAVPCRWIQRLRELSGAGVS